MKPDFSRCLFDPTQSAGMDTDPKLAELMHHAYREAEDEAERELLSDKLLRYVIIMYDPDSPFQKLYPDINERKSAAAELAGLIDSRQNEILFNCDSQFIVNLICRYLQIVNNRDWAIIVSYEQVIWELNERMMLKIKGSLADKEKDIVGAVNMKPKMAKDVIEMNTTLTALLKKFYGEDTVLYERAQKIRPEDFRTKREE